MATTLVTIKTPKPTGVHTLHIEEADGNVRQYGWNMGTIRSVALAEGEDRAFHHLRHRGARTIALKQNGRIVRIWDWRDLPENAHLSDDELGDR